VKYKSKPDNLKTVAQELGVSTILEGAVQKAGDKVRVNVQLIDARTDTHVWAKSYDRDFKDVLGVESEVSQKIAERAGGFAMISTRARSGLKKRIVSARHQFQSLPTLARLVTQRRRASCHKNWPC
jgi:hypothetical protein